MQVTVDGKNFAFDSSTVRTVGELIELVKATIDPDLMVSSILLGEHDLSDSDWQVPLAVHGTAQLRVQTSSRQSFVEERLSLAGTLIDKIASQFESVSSLLKKGDVRSGNTALSGAVEDLRAFVTWYNTILQLLPTEQALVAQKFQTSVGGMLDVCEKMLQQQLYRAWWAVAETIETKLLPEIAQLKASCLAGLTKPS
jgi:hypothetical protein